MSLTKIDWVATKITERSLDSARSFGAALGLGVIVDTPTQLMMQAPDGGVVEFCSSDYVGPAHLFARQDMVFGFAVTDIVADGAKLIDAGFESVTEITDGGPVLFQHFRGPDGRNYGLIQHK
jgi:hypothetical protein